MKNEMMIKLVPYIIALYMLSLFVVAIVLLPALPVLMLITYWREGRFDLPPFEDKL